MKNIITSSILLMLTLPVSAQARYDMQHIQKEKQNRGVVAVRKDEEQVYVSWRTLSSDRKGEPFNIYRNGKKLNNQPLTNGGTFYIDGHSLKEEALYEVVGGEQDGAFMLSGDAPMGYISIPLDPPDSGTTPDGEFYGYTANDASIGDVDNDGQYEIFLKWDPTNSHDNSHNGYTGNTYIDCYTLEGKRLWRVDLGHNIRSGAHYTPFIVYDLDGDGKAEMLVRTSDGAVDSKGNVIGDGSKDWRNQDGKQMEGPEFLTVFDGQTGKALASVDYIPARGNVMDWGDNRANRSDRMLAGVGYLDGIHPSAIFCRGYYTRTVLVAWDWDGKQLSQRWVFDTNDPGKEKYMGQGNHNLRIADVDGDGKDEITYGAMAIDDNGEPLYNTEFGHGDAIHLVATPKTNKLYIWDCHENKRDGIELRDAATGEVVFQIPDNTDVGRCMAADIDPGNPGVELWSVISHDYYDMEGNVAGTFKSRNMSTNFGIWWDGDLLRELLDHERVMKYNWKDGLLETIKYLEGCRFNNFTKSNPCLAADIIGDWREEIITRTDDSKELRIYVSDIPTDYRINCLTEDIPYRISVATQNVGYNQPSETGFYIGPDDTSYTR